MNNDFADTDVVTNSMPVHQHKTTPAYENPTILNNYAVPDYLKDRTKPDERMEVITKGMQDPATRMEYSNVETMRRAEEIRKNAQNEYNSYRDMSANTGRKNIFQYFDTKTRMPNIRNIQNNTERDMQDEREMKKSICNLINKVENSRKESHEAHYGLLEKQRSAKKEQYYPHGKLNLRVSNDTDWRAPKVNQSLPSLNSKDVFHTSHNQYQRNKMRLGNHAGHVLHNSSHINSLGLMDIGSSVELLPNKLQSPSLAHLYRRDRLS